MTPHCVVFLNKSVNLREKQFSAKHVFLVFRSTAVKAFMVHSYLFTNTDDGSGHVVEV